MTCTLILIYKPFIFYLLYDLKFLSFCYLFFLLNYSKTSLGSTYKRCGNSCGGQSLLGMPSKWEAQTFLQMAKKWRCLSTGGEVMHLLVQLFLSFLMSLPLASRNQGSGEGSVIKLLALPEFNSRQPC